MPKDIEDVVESWRSRLLLESLQKLKTRYMIHLFEKREVICMDGVETFAGGIDELCFRRVSCFG